MAKKKRSPADDLGLAVQYSGLLGDVVGLLEAARHTSARAVNAVMTATYWQIGRRIVEVEQVGRERATYGAELIERLSTDLSGRFGRGFSRRSLEQMRQFYLGWPIAQTLSAQLRIDTPIDRESRPVPAARFPLPWSHYVQRLTVRNAEARRFYEAEALRGGWPIQDSPTHAQSVFS